MYLNPRHQTDTGSKRSAGCVRPADASPEEDTMMLEHSFAALRQQQDTLEAILIGRRSSLQEDVAGGHHRGLGNELEASRASLRRREGEARAQKLAYTEHLHPNEEGSYSFLNPSHDHGQSGASRLDRGERFPADRFTSVGESTTREDRDRRGQSLGRLYHRRSSNEDDGDGEREQNMKRLSASSYFSSPTARSAAAAAAAFSDAYRTASLALALASPTNFSKGNYAADGRRSFPFGGLLKARAARRVPAHSSFAQSEGNERSEAWWAANDSKCGDTASGVNPLFERDGKTFAEGAAAAAAAAATLPAPVQPEAPPRQRRGSTSSLSASSASVPQGGGIVANPPHSLPEMGLSSSTVQPADGKRRDVLGGANSSDPSFPAGGLFQGDGVQQCCSAPVPADSRGRSRGSQGSPAADNDVSVGGTTDACSGHNAMHVQRDSSSRIVSWRSILACWASCSRATDAIDGASETTKPTDTSRKEGDDLGEPWGKTRAPASTAGGVDTVGPRRLSPTGEPPIDPTKPPATKTPVAVVENRRKKGRRRGRGGRPGRAGGESKRSPTRPRTDTVRALVPRPPASSAAESVATSAATLAAAVAAASSWPSSRPPSALAASKMATAAAAAAAEADSRNMKSAVDVAAAAAIAAALWQASGSFVSSPDSAAAPMHHRARTSPSPQQIQNAVSSECAPMPTGWVRAATAMLWQASDSDIISPGSAAASMFDEFDAPLTLERRITEASPSTVHRSPTIEETRELVRPVGGNGDGDDDGDSRRVGRRGEKEPTCTTPAAAPQEGSHAMNSASPTRETVQPEHLGEAATSATSGEAPSRAPRRIGASFFPASNTAEVPPEKNSEGAQALLDRHAQRTVAPASAAVGPRPSLKTAATASHPSELSPIGPPAAAATAAAAAAGVAAAAPFTATGMDIARGKEVTIEEASPFLSGCDVAKRAASDNGAKSGGSSTGGSKPGTESASPTSTSLTWESAAAPMMSARAAVGVERFPPLSLPSGGDANPDEAKTGPDPISAPPVWVLQYVDKSKRFGQAFLLSDGSVVVRFRDNTVMVAEPRRAGGGGPEAVEYYVEAATNKRPSLSTIGEGRPAVMKQQDDGTALESAGGGGGGDDDDEGGGRRRRERKRHKWNQQQLQQQQRKRDRHHHHPVRLRYTGQNVPPRLEKKSKLLACFCQRLYDLDGKSGGGASAMAGEVGTCCEKQGAGAGGSSAEMMITPESKKTLLWGPSVVVEAYRRTRHSRLFVLSDSTVQIKFSDNTEVLLSGDQQAVTFVHADGRRRETLAFARAVEEKRTDITRRVQYCRVAVRRLQEGQGSGRDGREGDTDVLKESNHHKTKSHP